MSTTTLTKKVYFFGNGIAEGNAKMRDTLGGKGSGLAEMTNSGVAVPAGFTITTEVCDEYYKLGKKMPAGLEDEVADHIKRLEKAMGMKLGDPSNPLLVSVRSGARESMPGMMDTILNLGINDEVVEGLIKKTNNPRFALDSYRRFIQMFSDVAMDVSKHHFEEALTKIKPSISDNTIKIYKKVEENYLKSASSALPEKNSYLG